MKTLTLLRHAKSSWDGGPVRDFDRPLNRRGRQAARAVGREMRELGLHFEQVIASPAVRVMETLRDVEEGYGHAIRAAFDRRVYLASTEALLEIVHGASDEAATLLVVGHNPGLENLALLLSADGALKAELAIKYPTGTLTEIQFAADHWADIAKAAGTITRFIRPRDISPELGPDQDS
jgi:phosphohistidine phosphatase